MFSNELTIGWLYNFFHILMMGMVWLGVLLVQGLICIPRIPSTLPFSRAYCKVPNLHHRLKRPVPLFCLALKLTVHGFDNASDLSNLFICKCVTLLGNQVVILDIWIPIIWIWWIQNDRIFALMIQTRKLSLTIKIPKEWGIEHEEYGGIEHKKDQEMEQENQQEMGSGQQDSKNKEWTVVEIEVEQAELTFVGHVMGVLECLPVVSEESLIWGPPADSLLAEEDQAIQPAGVAAGLVVLFWA
ncbi:hypothetical protein BS47DRAFT_1359090 [Hydnum rufescens UP504]|uniref:Uncharacterized protein n=1 Tax=Hydnum rufescens UP504 TaxID=1448309 RepID=A0A9P6B5E6_9AGAM|nr:hypothetical protein BS47DRAFT_1359090 [Hydnum rufescens UP504]